MKRFMAAIVAALLVSGSALAQSQPPPTTSYPAGWSPTGNTAALAVSNVSGNVVLGWVGVSSQAPPSVLVCNTGAVNAYVTLGGSTVTATTGGVLVAAGHCPLLALNGASYIAGITSSSTTNLSVMTGTGGSQSSLPGAGGPGSFMLSTGLNGTSAAFGNLVSAAGAASTITLGSTPLTYGSATTTIAGLTLTSPTLTGTTIINSDIGISSPANGQYQVASTSLGITLFDFGVTSASYFTFKGKASDHANLALRANQTNGFSSFLLLQPRVGAGSGVVWTDNASALVLGTNSTEQMRLYTGGGLHVGATAVDPGLNNIKVQGAVGVGGALTAPGLASGSGATTGTMCWTTSTGNVTINTTVACLTSDERMKTGMAPLRGSLSEVMGLRPITYRWNDAEARAMGRDEHIGLGAFATAYVDERLIARDAEGNPSAWRLDAVAALLAGAVQEQQGQIDRQGTYVLLLLLWCAVLSAAVIVLFARGRGRR